MTPGEWSPEGRTIRCLLDGEVVQEGHPADLVFDAAPLLADVSTFTALRPGSELVTEITGLGRITTPLTQERDRDR